MSIATIQRFAASAVSSLAWRGDELVDWVSGDGWSLDGTTRRSGPSFGYRFDAAVTSRDGRHAVIYERLGTKGLILDDGKLVRQIDRDYYHAAAYEFPVAIVDAPDGRRLIAHCPGHYCELHLETIAGERLTRSEARAPSDVFHSRLQPSPSGKRLLSAGWVWHPWDVVEVFDVARALAEPTHLDAGPSPSPKAPHVGAVHESSACWLDDDRVALASLDEPEEDFGEKGPPEEPCLRRRGVAIYDLRDGRCTRAFALDENPGTILPVGNSHLLSLYGHPKLVSLERGAVVARWPELRTGAQVSSIVVDGGAELPPPIAWDPMHLRLAVASDATIAILSLKL